MQTPDSNASPVSPPARVRLVLPHYRGFVPLKSYLPGLLSELATREVPVEVMVVDDGSDRLTQRLLPKWIDRLRHGFPMLLPARLLERNYGKGYAVRSGWAMTDSSVEVLAFVDSDGSVPAEAVAATLLRALHQPEHLYCGIRPDPARATRTLRRQLMGHTFAFIARRLLGIEVSDPQCGFKMIPAGWFRELQDVFRIHRFAFDCELLAHARQCGIHMVEVELPWKEAPTSTVRALRDGLHMLRDLRRIHKDVHKRMRQRLACAKQRAKAR